MSSKIEKLDIHMIYKEYLDAMKIPEDAMGPTQRIERKRAFMAGFTVGMKAIIDSAPEEDATEEIFKEFSEFVYDLQSQIRAFAEESVREHEELLRSIRN